MACHVSVEGVLQCKASWAFALFTFFLLEQKEPKIQDKPDPSGHFVGLPAPGRRPVASECPGSYLVLLKDFLDASFIGIN